MRSRLKPLLLALLATSVLSLLACAGSAPPVDHPDIVECGGPMANEVAERAAALALDEFAKGTATADQLKKLITAEIKTLAADYGPELVACLVDKALNAHRSPIAALQRRTKDLCAPHREAQPLAGLGFVPLKRADDYSRPWHTLLAGARGVRS